jgi:hypothetical protein
MKIAQLGSRAQFAHQSGHYQKKVEGEDWGEGGRVEGEKAEGGWGVEGWEEVVGKVVVEREEGGMVEGEREVVGKEVVEVAGMGVGEDMEGEVREEVEKEEGEREEGGELVEVGWEVEEMVEGVATEEEDWGEGRGEKVGGEGLGKSYPTECWRMTPNQTDQMEWTHKCQCYYPAQYGS